MKKTVEHLAPYQFKPGQSGNYAGRPKALFTKADVEVAFQRLAVLNLSGLQAIIDDPKTSNIDATIAMIWKHARETGDFAAMEFLLNRSVGRVKEVSEQTQLHGYAERAEIIDGVPVKQLVEMVRKEPK